MKNRKNRYNVFTIDLDNLEKEWRDQPEMARVWGRRMAVARKRHDEAEAAVEVIFAELDKAIRSDPAKYGVDKATEGAIKQCIICHKRYRKAVAKQINAKFVLGIVQANVNAVEHRKRALENEVELFGMNYWSETMSNKKENNREFNRRTEKRVARKPD